MNKYILILLLIFISLPSVSFCAVTNYSNGTITGTSFGEKTLPDAPIRWDNFEDGTDGVVIAEVVGSPYTDFVSSQLSATGAPSYSLLNQRTSDSTLNARFIFDIDYAVAPQEFSSSFLQYQFPSQVNDVIFTSMWVLYDKGTGGDDNVQHKVFRVTKGVDDTSQGIFLYSYERELPLADTVSFTIKRDSISYAPVELKVDLADVFTQGKWTQILMWATLGTLGNIKVAFLPEDKTPVWLDHDMNTLLVGEYLQNLNTGYYHGNSDVDATADWHFDDLYIDNSFYQVVVGDSSIYDDCTVLNLQPIVSWSDTEIVTTPNSAGLSSGYLFPLVDGVPQEPGYPVTFTPTPTPTTSGTIKGAIIKDAILK